MHNTLKTGIFLVLLAAILLFIGGAVGGRGGVIIALILALGMNVISYWFSDKIVLRMYSAREVGPDHRLYHIVNRLGMM